MLSGTSMMREMLELLRQQGYKKASLAVQKANYAVRMYEAVGFRIVDKTTKNLSWYANYERYLILSR